MIYFDAVVSGLALLFLIGSVVLNAMTGWNEAKNEGESFTGKVLGAFMKTLEGVVTFGLFALGVIVTIAFVILLWKDVVAVF